jgi:GTP pyrophosphokinase
MHREAENGIAAHWHYKEGRLSKEDETATTLWLRQLAEWKQEGASASEFIQNLRVDLFPKDIYVFTPKGKVLSFPRGATPIDFAYAVHSDVGRHCVGAKVNGKLVPLKTLLKSGDRVDIVTSPTGKPSRDWLSAAVTGRALSKIKAWLNIQEKKRAIELGKAALDRECRRLKVNLKEAEESGLLAKALKTVSLPDMDSLQAEIGYGKLSARLFARKLAPKEEAAPVISKIAAAPSGEPALEVRGASDFLTTLAKCCKPIRGDEIIGFISRGRGLMVHRADCPNIVRLGYNSDRIMPVNWGSAGSSAAATQDVCLDIRVEDKPGIVAVVTQTVADAKAPLRSIEGNVNGKGEGLVRLTIAIRDKAHLNTILAQFGKLPGILEVHRRNR